MASPQKENGFTPIAHELLRAFIRAHFSGKEWEAVMTIALHSYGQNRKVAPLSYNEFSAEIGKTRPRVIEAIKTLLERGVVRKLNLPQKTHM